MISEELFQYVIDLRRTIHRHPEIGVDCPVTAALIKRELESAGIEYSEEFCENSVVGYIGHDPNKKTLALRADMDALPVTEKSGVPFASEIPGKMHACGHDSHTAILIGVAKTLKAEEDSLSCNVRLVFQPSEECEVSGAHIMTDNGVMNGVDCIMGIHCEPTMMAGEVGIRPGRYMAACMIVNIVFHGRTSHATRPEGGIDAIRQAYESYEKIASIVKEEAAGEEYVWSVGRFEGGTAHNVIADRCELEISFRYYNEEFALRAINRVKAECELIAARFGGTVDVDYCISTHPVFNDPALSEQFTEFYEKETGKKPVLMPIRMSSEDFSWYLRKAPGFIARFGTGNEAGDCCAPAHRNDFKINEEGIRSGIEAFLSFARNYS